MSIDFGASTSVNSAFGYNRKTENVNVDNHSACVKIKVDIRTQLRERRNIRKETKSG